jgi:DNA-binding NarL/FixJ family response regulator
VTDTIRVLCVDDNPAVAEALRLKLSLEPGFTWVGHLECADDLVRQVQESDPDVVLLDVDMPGADPFAVLETLSNVHPQARTVMFTAHARGELVDRAVVAGAWGYLLKSEGTDALLRAIRRVRAGEFVVQPPALLRLSDDRPKG